MAETFTQANRPRFTKPVIGGVTSPFGMRGGKLHAGVDFGAPMLSPVRASMDGRVVRSEWFGGYGNAIDVYHGGGYMTRYAHLTTRIAKKDDAVKQGEVIGLVGNTGDSTGPHLHFEIRINGEPKNPLPLLGKEVSINESSDLVNRLNPIPPQFNDFIRSLTDTQTWLRLGMTLLGFTLLAVGIVSIIRGRSK